MSRFRFNFGQDDKRKTHRDLDDVVLSNDRQSRYSDYQHQEEPDEHFDRSPSMHPHRADDTRVNRTPQRPRPPENDPYQQNNTHAFKRNNMNRQLSQDDYPEHDNFLSMPPRHAQKQHASEYEQRSFAPSRQNRQSNDIKNLRFWNEEEQEAQYDDTEAETERPSLLKFIIAITGLVFIGTVAWLTYRWISMPTYDAPPLIEAESEPYRMRPQTPGGTDFPHQDKLIYDRLAPSSNQPVERLLPQPEQPTIMAPTYPQQHQIQQGQLPQQTQQAIPHAHGYPPQQQGYYQPQPSAPIQHQAAAPVIGQQPAYAVNQPHQQQAQAYAQQAQHIAPNQPYLAQANVDQQYAQHPAHMQQHPQAVQGIDEYDEHDQQLAHAPRQMAQNPAALMENESASLKQTPQSQLNAFVNSEVPAAPPIVDTTFYFLQMGTLINEDLAKKEKDRLKKLHAKELTDIDLLIKPYVSPDGSKKYRIVTKSVIQSRAAALDKCSRLGAVCKPVRN